ncbi:MAG TPA: aminofutalosine synthase MqnE [Desulfonatronum sp.]|nr:aminofutalosine synthase MqnE [Desulfonatronum sp.]
MLASIIDKVTQNVRLSADEAMTLVMEGDIHDLGRLALQVRRRRHGDKAFFVYNQHINYTNICQNACRFCAFSRRHGDKGAYVLSIDQVVREVQSRSSEPIRELHVVGGLNPDLPYTYYPSLVQAVKQARPEASVKAFTAVEVAFLAERGKMTPYQVLEDLRRAGLDALPGGGAEVFSPALRKQLCPEKISGEAWLNIHRIAHQAGIPSNATMLFGHVESWEDRISHLLALRNLQDQTGGFLCFIPLPYQPRNNALGAQGPDGLDIMRMMAVSRIFLDNIPHLKAYWVMTGVKTAQMALWYGADDMDGTVTEERIGHAAGAQSPKGLTRTKLVQAISQSGFAPVERDSRFRAVIC